ncbi:hypothetical protein, partial [Calidithermus terrae]|uniref:hypothetical protein n=1 Tax=Calidithermus terrae TaxID=1408545 RepID=UPI001C3F5D99
MIRRVHLGGRTRLYLRLLPLLLVLLCANAETRQAVSGALEHVFSSPPCSGPACVALEPPPAKPALPGPVLQPLSSTELPHAPLLAAHRRAQGLAVPAPAPGPG